MAALDSLSSKEVPPGFEKDLENISIDFDGVIHDFSKGWHDGTCYGDPLPGAIDAIKKLSSHYNVIIFTAKAKPSRPLVNGKTGTELVAEWLDKHGVLDCIDEITCEKPRSQVYVDDKGYHFQNWDDTMRYLESKYEKL